MDDLRKIEAALLATKSLLGSSEMDELARKQEAEFAGRLWRGRSDRDLWKQPVSVRAGWIIFRIKRDKHAYIGIEVGEDGTVLPVQLYDLEALEEGLLAAMAALRSVDGKHVTD